MSRLHRVVAASEPGFVDVRDLDGTVHRVSLLAFEGSMPGVGDWLVVHSGYALAAVDAAEAESIAAELRLSQQVREDR